MFPKGGVQEEDGMIVSFEYDHYYDLLVVLSNKSEVYFVELQTEKQIYFKLEDNLPHKLKQLKFGKFSYQLMHTKKGGVEPYILLRDDTGFIVQFPLSEILASNSIHPKAEPPLPKHMFKDTHAVTRDGVPLKTIWLNQNNHLKLSYEEMGLMKESGC